MVLDVPCIGLAVVFGCEAERPGGISGKEVPVGDALQCFIGRLVIGGISPEGQSTERSEGESGTVLQSVVHLYLFISFSVDEDDVRREPRRKVISQGDTHVGTAAELIFVLERLHDIAFAPKGFLCLELGGRDESAAQRQVLVLPRDECVLDVGNAFVVMHIVRLSHIHDGLELQAVFQRVLIAQVAAVECKSAVVVVASEARMYIAEDSDDGFPFSLRFVVVGLCSGKKRCTTSQSSNHPVFLHHVVLLLF